MGFGLTYYIPFVIYGVGLLIAVLSVLWTPKIGVLFLFPLLPYQNIFQKIQDIPLGKDLNDIIIGAILFGWLIRGGGRKDQNISNNHSLIFLIQIYFYIFFQWYNLNHFCSCYIYAYKTCYS